MRVVLSSFMLLSTLCAWTAAVSGPIYKWVDQNGVTHYSDQPNPGAEKVQVSSTPSSASAASSAASTPRSPDVILPTEQSGAQYNTCEISSPTNDQVFMNVGEITGSLRLEPQLYSGHRVTISLDGKKLEDVAAGGGSFTLSSVERGAHTLSATVEDSAGGVLCQSSSVTFHVRQPSAQAPRRANRPRF